MQITDDDIGGQAEDAATAGAAPAPRGSRTILEVVLAIGCALLFLWAVQGFVMKSYQVPTGSMTPTLPLHAHILVDRLSLDFSNPGRGQIVVFHPPACAAPDVDVTGVCTTTDRAARTGLASITFVKRVIGLPGETVSARAGRVWVTPADGGAPFPLHEPYVGGQPTAGLGTVHVPKGYYLLLGDNRPVSEDSRTWGLEPRDGMIGIVRATYWPLSGATLF